MFDFLALFFYLTHIPERFWSHTFDIWVSVLPYFSDTFRVENGKLIRVFWGLQGASHQIFHILIDVGQVVFLLGLRKVMLRHCSHVGGPVALQIPQETSLSLWVEPKFALLRGNEAFV